RHARGSACPREPDRGAHPAGAPGDRRRRRAYGAAMKLCMFSPQDQDLERGWPARIEGETLIQLAAQTLQAFFTGGGEAREHAVYPLADVVLRAPVLHPPSVRIYERGDFRFANPAAILNPDAKIPVAGAVPTQRDAAIIGADGRIGGFTQ